MARLIAALGLSALALAARADELAAIRARLDAHSRVRAEFVQTKRIADAQRPLVSRGRMLVWGATGVIWEIEQPFQAAYALREGTTVQVVDGQETVRGAEDDAVSTRVGRVLRALLHGDARSLEQWFEIGARASAERWTITLTPRQGPLASALKSMQVSGREYVESVSIDEASGDATRIQFHNHRDGGALSPLERRLLATD